MASEIRNSWALRPAFLEAIMYKRTPVFLPVHRRPRPAYRPLAGGGHRILTVSRSGAVDYKFSSPRD